MRFLKEREVDLRRASTTRLDSSITLTRGRCRCSTLTTGELLGVKTRSAIAANRAGPTPIRTSGSRALRAASKATTRAKDLSDSAIRSAKVAAISLKARYCKRRAKRISLASRRARSSSSSTSPLGRRRAAFKSKRVAATTKNSVA